MAPPSPKGTWAVGLPGLVDVSSVLDAVDENGVFGFEDLVDYAVVAASCRAETSSPRASGAEPLGVIGDWSEDRFQCGVSNLVGESIQVTQTLGSDPDLVHRCRLNVVAEPQPLTF
jgi:hypothetical protein